MAIIDIYSKRKKAAERSNQAEIYQYTSLPIQFRRQVIYIWKDAIGTYRSNNVYATIRFKGIPVDPQVDPHINQVWQSIYKSLARELGLPESSTPNEECMTFFLDPNTHTDNLLDVIEITFRHIERSIPRTGFNISQRPNDAINELNDRFREHGIGYQYIKGQIIRVDSLFIHAEAVMPALTLISSEGFIGAEQEFRSAHEHYRNKEYKAAIFDAAKAFESTMKTICDKLGWAYNHDGDTAAILINTVLRNELIPKYLQSHFSALKRVLESGLPTVRNKEAGHGQGAEPVDVPQYLAAYALHLAASNIGLLVEAYKAKRSEINS
jgi:hypothetical protein